MVTQFPLDALHMFDLGVGKYIMKAFVHKESRDSDDIDVPLLCSQYASYARLQPSDFARSPRSLKDIANFKATECHQFLLYGGIVLLKQHLSEHAYTHFLRLSLGYRIISSYLFQSSLDIAQLLFEQFEIQFLDLYPDGGLGYNVHGLLHIVADVKLYGTVDSFSAYKFENQIQLIGNSVRKPNQVLAQVFNRLHEIKITGIKLAPRKYNPLNLQKGDSCLLNDFKT